MCFFTYVNINRKDMYPELQTTIDHISDFEISNDRKQVLQRLIDYIVDQV